ncbi:ABC transporter permease [Aerosakkonema funiforme]|uniref:ABC transporter permease n=1 Tax=Aerosakkonema funiforme FACHB-1375 TaxID=2949571 RepID=A0A926ZGD0_9CYAN|nr:ABC transporter permease [Aerosakkonema funiforme]MBD2179646.1 ABC transporter permease [Aerosakkonema funiforme FACHB-1375]
MDNLTFFTDYLIASLRLSVPLAFAALGGLFSERSGVLNIALEGMLLSGAFAGAAGAFFTGNVWVGMLSAIAVGGMVGLLHSYLCVTLRVDQLVSGLAINLTAIGLTSFWSRILFNSNQAQQLPSLKTVAIPILEDIPIIGNLIFNQDPLIYFLFLLVPLTAYLLFRTSLGLSLRAVGEYPRAADTAGISVNLVRYVAVTISGCFAGLGGAYLALVHVKYFAEGMSAGKGFIALAALIFGKWHPVSTAFACLLFGATEALQLRIQAFNLNIPYQFLVMLPYVIALLALVGLAGKSTPPAALGIPYIPESRDR